MTIVDCEATDVWFQVLSGSCLATVVRVVEFVNVMVMSTFSWLVLTRLVKPKQ